MVIYTDVSTTVAYLEGFVDADYIKQGRYILMMSGDFTNNLFNL